MAVVTMHRGKLSALFDCVVGVFNATGAHLAGMYQDGKKHRNVNVTIHANLVARQAKR